jgi:hypothetical protein
MLFCLSFGILFHYTIKNSLFDHIRVYHPMCTRKLYGLVWIGSFLGQKHVRSTVFF